MSWVQLGLWLTLETLGLKVPNQCLRIQTSLKSRVQLQRINLSTSLQTCLLRYSDLQEQLSQIPITKLIWGTRSGTAVSEAGIVWDQTTQLCIPISTLIRTWIPSLTRTRCKGTPLQIPQHGLLARTLMETTRSASLNSANPGQFNQTKESAKTAPCTFHNPMMSYSSKPLHTAMN